MIRNLLSIIAAGFVAFAALSIAANWQGLAELREVGVLVHLASYSEVQGQYNHHPGTEFISVLKTHVHKHRHSPKEPEHEHAHTDPGFMNSAASAVFTASPLVHRLAPTPEFRPISPNEEIPSGIELVSLFRPPIS